MSRKNRGKQPVAEEEVVEVTETEQEEANIEAASDGLEEWEVSDEFATDGTGVTQDDIDHTDGDVEEPPSAEESVLTDEEKKDALDAELAVNPAQHSTWVAPEGYDGEEPPPADPAQPGLDRDADGNLTAEQYAKLRAVFTNKARLGVIIRELQRIYDKL